MGVLASLWNFTQFHWKLLLDGKTCRVSPPPKASERSAAACTLIDVFSRGIACTAQRDWCFQIPSLVFPRRNQQFVFFCYTLACNTSPPPACNSICPPLPWGVDKRHVGMRLWGILWHFFWSAKIKECTPSLLLIRPTKTSIWMFQRHLLYSLLCISNVARPSMVEKLLKNGEPILQIFEEPFTENFEAKGHSNSQV